jgi:hypothetical protein
MIKTEHDKVLTLYCQDQKIITNGKLLRVELGFPYQIMSFRYVGKSSTEYTRGDFYNVIDCGPYWHTNEIVVWVTDNGHPETTDVDYCTTFSFDAFLSDFEYDSKYLELMNKAEKTQEELEICIQTLITISTLANGDENIVIGNFVDSRLSKFAKTYENVTKYIQKATGKNIDVVLAENAALEEAEGDL